MRTKTVFITGSSRGIGRACALRFAAAGYHVFINCKKSIKDLKITENKITQNGGSCTSLTGDVANPDDVRRIFHEIERICSGLNDGDKHHDVLVNNAGVAYIGLLTDMSDADWDHILSANLSSAFYCCRAAIPAMVSAKEGKIINISSMWGTGGASCEAAYSAAKSGLHGLTKALGKELAPSNIQVNAIACGVIDTAMNNQLTETEKKELEYEIPAGRFATPKEVAELVFDLSQKHTYLTSQIIGFDGGFL